MMISKYRLDHYIVVNKCYYEFIDIPFKTYDDYIESIKPKYFNISYLLGNQNRVICVPKKKYNFSL